MIKLKPSTTKGANPKSLKDNPKRALGLRIKRARQLAGLSQRDVADALKVSDKTVSAYEVGRAEPSLESLNILSQLMSQPVSYFVTPDDDRNSLSEELKDLKHDIAIIKQTVSHLVDLVKRNSQND